ncbi:hypothetical protein MHYP_G00134140 [Metynnis hypsauchen]
MVDGKNLSAGLAESDTTCRAACVSGKYYFEVMAHVLSKAGPYWASEEHNVEQKGSVSLIVRCINPNQLWEGILTSEGLGRVSTCENCFFIAICPGNLSSTVLPK